MAVAVMPSISLVTPLESEGRVSTSPPMLEDLVREGDTTTSPAGDFPLPVPVETLRSILQAAAADWRPPSTLAAGSYSGDHGVGGRELPTSAGFARGLVLRSSTTLGQGADPPGQDLVEHLLYGTRLQDLGLTSVRKVFDEFGKAGIAERETTAARLREIADPKSLVRIAMESFSAKGNAERLLFAAEVLEGYGRDALLVLESLGASGLEECEYFVETLAGLAQDPLLRARMADVLEAWSRHAARDVRLSLLEVSEDLPTPLRKTLLTSLSQDPDKDIARTALELLASDE